VRNFLQIGINLDVVPLLHAIYSQPDLWDQNKLRTTHEMTPHKQVSDIWIRFNEVPSEPSQISSIIDEHESVWYPAVHTLPQVRPLISWIMSRVEGERLGRVLITRLAPGKVIEPHVDGGSHAAYYERYHIPLQSSPGCVFRCGDEEVFMRAGDCWWFNNALEHSVINNGTVDRLHLIVDIKTFK
jgi:hypothetical protein